MLYSRPYQGTGGWDLSSSSALWGEGDQEVPSSAGGLFNFALGATAVGGIGALPYGEGRVFDLYMKGIRAFEERSPGKILRTFQLSTWLSPLETATRESRFIPASEWTRWLGGEGGPTALGGYYQQLLGLSPRQQQQIMAEGATFAEGKLFMGHGSMGNVLLEHAQIFRTTTTETRAMDAYSRAMEFIPSRFAGGGLFTEIAETGKPFAIRTHYQSLAGGQILSDKSIIGGGKTAAEAYGRIAKGVGTDLVQRFNRLLWGTSDFILDTAKKIPFGIGEQAERGISFLEGHLGPLGLGVEREVIQGGQKIFTHTTGLKTFGKLALKLGVGLPLAVGAWQTVDWATRELGTEGINAAIGKSYMYGKLALSTAAEYTGLHAFREWQDESAPGSTSLIKLAAFPATFGFMGMVGGYFNKQRVHSQIRGAAEEAVERLKKQGTEESLRRAARLESTIDFRVGRAVKTAAESRRYQGKIMRYAIDALHSERAVAQGGLSGRALEWLRTQNPTRLRGWLGVGLGAALVAPFIAGALIPSDRPEAIWGQLTGEEDVAIRRGRWWPAGRSDWEGDRIQQWRPHAVALMRANPIEESLYGGPTSPLTKWFTENFSYGLENTHYYDRPYAQSGSAFESVPLIGPLLSATIGKITKPTKFYHMSEWMGQGEGGGLFSDGAATLYPSNRQTPAIPGLGGTGPGALRAEGTLTDTIGEQVYRMTEMAGLPGFILEAAKTEITGRPGYFDQEARLQTAGAMYGSDQLREFWESEINDPGGFTEAWRRLYPHKQRQIPRISPPIRNTMPQWLPSAGDKSADFQSGDPYMNVPMGEAVLPGRGMVSLHPELEGVAPEDYPLFWQFYSLARAAPYSGKYKQAVHDMRVAQSQGLLSEDEIGRFERIQEQVRQQKEGVQYFDRQYLGPGIQSARDQLLESNLQAKRGGGSGLIGSTLGAYWEMIALNLETPLEALTPVAPASKLLHARTPTQAYEREVLYGKKMSMWGSPIQHFIKPFAWQTAHQFGWEGIPDSVQDQRAITEYFDILEYVKATRLKRAAEASGDYSMIDFYEDQRRSTMAGINAMTTNFAHIYRALPGTERDYFNAFAQETLDAEKVNILQKVPEPIKPLLVGQWHVAYARALQQAIKFDELVGMSKSQAQEEIGRVWEMKDTEGFPMSEDLYNEFLANRLPKESYADWFRRKKIAQRVQELGFAIPGPDWVGMNPAVDLDDIKYKFVEDAAMNFHDFSLWPDRGLSLAYKPYVDQGAIDQMYNKMTSEQAEGRLRELFMDLDISMVDVSMQRGHGPMNGVDLNVEYDVVDEFKGYVNDLRNM